MTLFQAVGGMDSIAKAFQKKLTGKLQLGCRRNKITNTESGVQVYYKQAGVNKIIEGDYCICTIPLPVLSNIEHNFSSNVSRAIDYIPYIPTGKIGLQFNRSFWEEDEHIYGGITHTNNELTQIFYPSNNYLSRKGILIGYYNFYDKAVQTGALNYKQREALALAKGRLIHPQYDQYLKIHFRLAGKNALCIGWLGRVQQRTTQHLVQSFGKAAISKRILPASIPRTSMPGWRVRWNRHAKP